MSIFAGLQSFIPERLEHFLYKYGEIAKVYVAAFDGKGELLVNFACSEEERQKIDQVFQAEDRKELFQRVTEFGLEDQVVEDTALEGIKIAASAIKQKGRTQMVWMFLGQIKEGSEGEDDIESVNSKQEIMFERQTTLSLFFWAIDVLRDMGLECIQAQHSVAEWEAANRRNQNSASEMTGSMQRMEIIMEILQYLDSDKAIEYIMQEFLQLTAVYLHVDIANIIQVKEDQIKFIAQWGEENTTLNHLISKGKLELPEGRKPKILSFDSPVLRSLREEYSALPFKAVTLMPVEIGKQTNMYVCYYDTERDRIWKLDEIQFMKDTIRILQSILEKRIQKKSIASSYTSLEEILETPSIDKKAAESIYNYFNGNK